MPQDESHVQTQPLRVSRVPGASRDRIVVESLLQKPAAKGVEPGERLIGRRYRLKERLRRRRPGIVFAAVDELGWLEGQQRRVAIQFLDARLAGGPDFPERFERGVATLQALEHRGLVATFDAGRDGSRYFVVVEMPDSGTLRYVLDDAHLLPPTEVGAVVRAIGDALEYLHARSIVHGNLKPENVVVTFDFDVKLQDVVPPEWPLADENRTVRDDVYGLACLAYEMLSGRHPFDGNSTREALRNGLKPEPIPHLPPKQWHALVAALELDPAHRTPTVRQFLEQFGVIATAGLRDIVENDVAASPPIPLPAPPAAQPAPWISGSDVVIPARSRYEPRRVTFGGKLLLVILAALVALAWKYQDVIRDETTAFVAMVNAWVPAAPAQDATRAADTTPAAAVETPPVQGETAETQPVTPVAADAVPTPLPAPVKPTAKAEPAAPAGPERFSFGQAGLRVAESAVAARVVIRRSGDLRNSAAIAWWTAPATATAERDFADLGRKVERFQPGERERTVYVPLSNDSDAESSEYFNVFIGDVRGGMAPQTGIRIDIADDD